jgi:hypothetical protein
MRIVGCLGSNTVAADIQHCRYRMILQGADLGDTMPYSSSEYPFAFSRTRLHLEYASLRVRGEIARQ